VAENVTRLPSIQGEQQQENGRVRASQADVDRYVDRVSDEVLACRERGRHLFPAIREAGIEFTDVDDDGLFVRRLRCTCCELAVKVEKWEGVKRGRNVRFQRVAYSVASKALQGQSLAALRKTLKRSGGSKTNRAQ
jgi:hypothetical protein